MTIFIIEYFLGGSLMKEIGGYFSLEQLINNEYYSDLIALNSGRNALLYIIRAKNIRKLYIPSFLCNSISSILELHDFEFVTYKIDSNFMPIFDSERIKKDEYIYIVNYYGQLDNHDINKLKKKYRNIIVDNAQAFFSKPITGIDTIYTCRKFFGVPDGSYLSTDTRINEKLATDKSKDRMNHILGRYEGVASEYYNEFRNNQETFINEPIKYMSKLTKNLLGAIDYDKVYKIRNENYDYLDSRLAKYNKREFKKSKGPFAYPFYIKERGTEIRKELSKRKIYVPTLWPNVLNDVSVDSLEYDYAENILLLPCDQRYTIEDMKFIVEQLLNII